MSSEYMSSKHKETVGAYHLQIAKSKRRREKKYQDAVIHYNGEEGFTVNFEWCDGMDATFQLKHEQSPKTPPPPHHASCSSDSGAT